ncbi:hypothetical protein [Lysinibacillus sp. TE18511]
MNNASDSDSHMKLIDKRTIVQKKVSLMGTSCCLAIININETVSRILTKGKKVPLIMKELPTVRKRSRIINKFSLLNNFWDVDQLEKKKLSKKI